MNKRFMLFVTLLLIVPLLLAACGGDDDDDKGDDDNGGDDNTAETLNADEFEAAILKTFNEGDPSDMNALICEAEQMSQDGATQFNSMSAEWTADCSVDGDTYSCNVNTEGVELVMNGAIEDGIACNSTVTMNGQELPMGDGSE